MKVKEDSPNKEKATELQEILGNIEKLSARANTLLVELGYPKRVYSFHMPARDGWKWLSLGLTLAMLGIVLFFGWKA